MKIIFIYPDNLTAKPKMWLWELRDLLDHGMDFEKYRQWAQARHCSGHEETLQALTDHWSEINAELEQTQEIGGQTFG